MRGMLRRSAVRGAGNRMPAARGMHVGRKGLPNRSVPPVPRVLRVVPTTDVNHWRQELLVGQTQNV